MNLSNADSLMRFVPGKVAAALFWDRARARNPALFDRLMARTDRQSSLKCWKNGYANKHRYGLVQANSVSLRCHRAMYALAFGPIPDGMCVCHKCDVPSCVNPAHLFLGTHDDNMADRARKGRVVVPHGETHHSAKLTEQDVRCIRASSEGPTALARRYGMARNSIRRIRSRVTWSHVK